MAEDLMDKVFSFFAGENITDEKQSMLKQTAKDLSQNKYAKFFKIKSEEIDASLSSFFFSVYRMIYPLRMFMRDEKKMARLKQLVIEAFMDGAILETINRLDPATLENRAKTAQPQDLVNSIQEDMDRLVSQFDGSRIATADRSYNMVAALKQFVNYNFVGFFKKFDTHFADGSFSIEPKFPVIKAVLVINEIGEFLSVTQPLKPDDDWKGLLNLIRNCAGQELVPPDQFYAMIKTLREIHASKILELMIQYTLRNPVWAWKPKIPHESIAEDWLAEKRAEVDKYINQINNARKNSQIASLTKLVFEATDLFRLENYTVQVNEIYRKKDLDYLLYAEGLNYLKTFLEDYLDKEIKELCDILLIRGQWTNNAMAREMSEALHRLLDVPPSILALDEAMAENGSDGSRLRAAVLRVDRDRTQARYINTIIGKSNSDALDIINDATQDFITIGKHLKSLVDDVQKKHHDLLINWRELNQVSKIPIEKWMIDDCKRISYFCNLMTLCRQIYD
ncbi:MAG: DUF5312 family protein [Treponema sp.]|jgi:hypothetical protein|nr:DUF5312 family protein [Treponema sp.]